MNDFAYHDYLQVVADEDVRFILEREKIYKGSWKKSGGRSAWFMLVRKMDRLQEMMKLKEHDDGSVPSPAEFKKEHDIFEQIKFDPSGRDGTVLAEIRDLRRYLALVESEMMATGVVKDVEKNIPGTPYDGSHHSKYNELVSPIIRYRNQVPPIVNQ
jgi:hypothetical protein